MQDTIDDLIEYVLAKPHAVHAAVGELVAGGIYHGHGAAEDSVGGVGIESELGRVARMRAVLPMGAPSHDFADTGETAPEGVHRSMTSPYSPRSLGIKSYDKIGGQS